MQLHTALVMLETAEVFITIGEKHTEDAFGVEPYSCHFPERNFYPNSNFLQAPLVLTLRIKAYLDPSSHRVQTDNEKTITTIQFSAAGMAWRKRFLYPAHPDWWPPLHHFPETRAFFFFFPECKMLLIKYFGNPKTICF